ncbi:ABC transporter ATP-binding protein [Umezawaea beigongshangensis]|uniref:ATP-binding cassette domain-containing protein n=1 Tax=Umezawaea beigongshangensis TaxID=2780383 RepID=UPI001E4D8C2A
MYVDALAGQRREALALLGWSLLEGVPALLSGRLVALAVDRGFAAGEPWTGVAWLVAFGVTAVLGAVGSRLVFRQLGAVVEPMRDALVAVVVRGVLRGGNGARSRPDAGGVARLTRHVEVVRDVTAGLLVQSRSLLVTTVAALVGIFGTAGELAWPVTLPVLLALLLFALLLRTLAARQRDLVLADERIAEVAGTVQSGVRDVVACGAQDEAGRAVAAEVDAQAAAAVRLARAGALRTLVVAVGGYAPLVLVLAVAPGLVASGRLTAGAVLGTVVYLTTNLQPALLGLAESTGSAVLRLVVTLRRLSEAATAPAPATGALVPSGSAIGVRGLTFGYGAHAEPVVRDLDLDLRPGDHLAVIGPSGIGKSTLAGLLVGLERPDRGHVLLGGVPVHEVAPAVRHRIVALVPQEAYVFTGTVRDNLALFAPDACDEDLLAAVEAVGAGDLVRGLGGLSGEVGHGDLSTGQAQLLAAARVHASPADVVVLDEATSSLDAAAEAVVERAFAERGGVLVVIAHRLSSALRADRVLVMDGGTPLLGEHGELLATSPLYADLMRAWTGPNAVHP